MRASAPAPVVAEVVVPAPRRTWAELAGADGRALPSHGPAWTDALVATGRWTDASRLYVMGDGRRAVLPLLGRRGIDEGFPEGWGIGGPIGAELDPTILEAVIRDLAGRRDVLATRFRPDPTTAALWAGIGPGAGIGRRAHVLDLPATPEQLWDDCFRSSVRRSLRKAEKAGVEVECDTSGRLLPVLEELTAQSERRWAASTREPLALARWRARRRDPGGAMQSVAASLDGGFRLWVARHDGQPVAAIVVLVANAAHYTRGAMDRERAGPVRATHLLQWHAMRDAIGAGCRTYHMGDSGESSSLARYKESFGASPVEYADVRVERLPLTAADQWGRRQVKRLIRMGND